jgi:hypothetical protein
MYRPDDKGNYFEKRVIDYKSLDSIPLMTSKGKLLQNTLYATSEGFSQNVIYLKLDTLLNFQEDTKNQLFVYFWVFNNKEKSDSFNVGYCNTDTCTNPYMFTDFFSSKININPYSISEFSIGLKRTEGEKMEITVNDQSPIQFELKECTFMIYSDNAEFGLTNFRFFISK